MNLFILDTNFNKNAKYHCNSHCIKIILECTQGLSTSLIKVKAPQKYLPISSSRNEPYRATHQNHPIINWIQESSGNFNWVVDYALALCKEYTYRYDKTHKLEKWLAETKKAKVGNEFFPRKFITTFCQCFGEDNQHLKRQSSVEAYRLYYNVVKRKTIKMEWKRREQPEWYRNFDYEAFVRQNNKNIQN